MEQKTKFILVGVIGVAVIFVFLYLQALNSKQLLIKERDTLKKDNIALNGTMEKLTKDLRDAQDKMSSLRQELNTAGQEKEELQKKYDTLQKNNEELINKLQAKPVQVQAAPMAPSGRSDEYWASILQENTKLQMQLEEIGKDLKTYQVRNEELLREKNALELELGGLKRQQEELEHQMEYNKKIMDNIAQQLVWEKNERLKVEEKLTPLKKENASLSQQLKSLNKQKIDLERRLQKIQEEKGGLAQKLGGMESMLVERISQIDGLKDELEEMRTQMRKEARFQPAMGAGVSERDKESGSVELPPIVVRPAENAEGAGMAMAAPKHPDGAILTVNRESNFVIVDLGEEAGITTGTVFQVERGGEPIGMLEVIKTSKSVSACDIKEEKTPIRTGDVVR